MKKGTPIFLFFYAQIFMATQIYKRGPRLESEFQNLLLQTFVIGIRVHVQEEQIRIGVWVPLTISQLGLGGIGTEKRKSALRLYLLLSSPHLQLLQNTEIPLLPLPPSPAGGRVRSQRQDCFQVLIISFELLMTCHY